MALCSNLKPTLTNELNNRLPAWVACTFNRVLAVQPERLRLSLCPFAGKTLGFVLENPEISLSFVINKSGELDVLGQDIADPDLIKQIQPLPDVQIRLGSLPRPPFTPASLLAKAHIAGNAELAEHLSFLFKNLTVHPGDWVHPWLGDIMTHRLELAAQKLTGFIRERLTRFSA